MITKLSYQLANKIALSTGREDEDYIRYGLEITLISVFKLSIYICIALIFDVIAEMVVIVGTFAILRGITGGVHMSTYPRCLISSIILFFTPILLLKYLVINISSTLSIISTFIFALIVTIIYVPVSAANRTIPVEKHNYFKRKAIIYLFIWLIINYYIVKYIPQYSSLSILSAIGILIQSFTLVPFGYRFFTNIDDFLSKKNWR